MNENNNHLNQVVAIDCGDNPFAKYLMEDIINRGELLKSRHFQMHVSDISIKEYPVTDTENVQMLRMNQSEATIYLQRLQKTETCFLY